MMQHSDLIYVKRIKGKGRGVFARRTIPRGTVIEKVPVLAFPVKLVVGGFKNREILRYFFLRNRTTVAVALGYGSLYNHSYTPNAHYEDGAGWMEFTAIRKIKKGEEITINYNGDPKDRSPMVFAVR